MHYKQIKIPPILTLLIIMLKNTTADRGHIWLSLFNALCNAVSQQDMETSSNLST